MVRKICRWFLPGMALFGLGSPLAWADAHCGDLGDCRVLIEMNASDGDVGIHALFDGGGWVTAEIVGPGGSTIFETELMDDGSAPLASQELTETFFESTEPFCEQALAEEEGEEEFKTLATFLSEFLEGDYTFNLANAEAESGMTRLTHDIPAAPADVEFDGKYITWEYGEDFGECVTVPAGFGPIGEEGIVAYEVVMEPDVEDPVISNMKFTIRVPPSVNKVRVPKAYLDALPANVALKAEVGAIEHRTVEIEEGVPVNPYGNQTFTEEDGFCNNRSQSQCEEED